MRSLVLFIFFFIFTSTLKATQHVGSIWLDSQEEIAEFFAINYEVDSIIGNVEIFNGLDITSLQPLKGIKYIEGRLTIRHCRQLATLEGLNENLTVTGIVELRELLVLKNIEPLRNVNSTTFFITECRLLGNETSTKVNPNVTQLSIYDFAGSNLDFLSYYPKLQYLGISNGKKLENINGISNLHELQDLVFVNNKMISGCTIDSLCTKMQNGLKVIFEGNDNSCDSLVNIANNCIALDLSCIDTTLHITSKGMLDYLLTEGMECAENVRQIRIDFQSDDEFISLEGLPVFPNLTNIAIDQTKNLKSLSGLNSYSKIRKAWIRSNDDLEDLGSTLEFDEENIDVNIKDNPKLRSIGGISNVRSVSNFILESNHPELIVPENIFDDLLAEDEVRLGGISSDISPVLKNVKACNSLYLDSTIMVADDISHIDISETLSLNGIEELTSIDFKEFPNALNSLVISNCKNITTVDNIKVEISSTNLVFFNSGIVNISFDDDYPIQHVTNFVIDKIEIEHITLPVIDYLRRIRFQNCPNLTSIDFYSNVGEINELNIYNNSSLESLGEQIQKFISIESLYILNNESLIDISALGHNVGLDYDLTIYENPKLGTCDIDAICRLINSGGSIFISNNAGDCEKFALIEACESVDIKPLFNPSSLVISNQSTLDYFAETYSKIDSVGGSIYIKIDYSDEDMVRDLSFFDSLEYIGYRLSIKGENINQADTAESLDLSNFDHCGFVNLEISNVLFDRLPIIAGGSPIEGISIETQLFDGDFSPFNEVDTLHFLNLRMYNTTVKLTGFVSLVHVAEFQYWDIDNTIGDFCSSLSSIDELFTWDCARGSLPIFDNVKINDRLMMRNIGDVKDEDLKFDLQKNCTVFMFGGDSLTLSFLEGTQALNRLSFQNSRSPVLNFEFLNDMDLGELHLNDISSIESIVLSQFNGSALTIDKCSKLRDIHLLNVQNIPLLEVIDCQNFQTMNVPLLSSMNVFKLINTSVKSLEFISDETIIKFLKLHHNQQFEDCADLLFCNNLELGNSISLTGNNGNCDIYNLNDACGNELPKCPTGDFYVTTAQNYTTFIEEYSTCTSIPYNLTINKSVVVDPLFVDDVSVILGDLTILEGTGMSNELDLSNLGYINGSLTITGGDFSTTVFDDVEVFGQLSISDLTNELLDATDIFSPSGLEIVDCNKLGEINLNGEDYFYGFVIENCPQLQRINPLELSIGGTFSLKNLENYNEVNEILEMSYTTPSHIYIDNLPLIDTINLSYRPRTLLSLTNNENLSKIIGCCNYSLSFLDISNCDKIEEIDLDSMFDNIPREVLIDSNENLNRIVLQGANFPNWKSEVIGISNNPSLVDISFSDGKFASEKLIINNNDLLDSFVIDSNVEFDSDDVQLTNNDNLGIINIDTSAIVGEFIAENNATLNDISGFGDNEMDVFALVNNDNLSDISNINQNLVTNNLRVFENFALDVCNYNFVCNHIASGKPITLYGNGSGCENVADVNALCLSNLFENASSSLNVYPNPVFNQLTVDDDLIRILRLINPNGTIVKEVVKGLKIIDVSDLSSGLYYLQIVYEDGTITYNTIIKM